MQSLLIAAATVFHLFASPQLSQAAAQAKKGDAVIVDVREADELEDGMVASAYWLATSEIEKESPRYKDILARLPKGKPVYTYCRSGGRAEAFAQKLRAKGYQVENLGGFARLEKSGFPVQKVAGAKSQPCPYLCGPGGK